MHVFLLNLVLSFVPFADALLVRGSDAWEDELDLATDVFTYEAIEQAGQATLPLTSSSSTDDSTIVARKAASGGEEPLWVFGAHHKSGTYLMRALAGHQVNSLGQGACSADQCSYIGGHKRCETFGARDRANVWYPCNFNITQLAQARAEAKTSGRQLRVVHLIRDPLAVVLSGYMFHTRVPEYDSSSASPNATMSERLRQEAQQAIAWQLRDMFEIHQDPGKDIMVIRFEDFTRSSESFDRTIANMYSFTVGDLADRTLLDSLKTAAQAQDCHRHPPKDSDHVKRQELMSEAAEAIKLIPAEILGRLHEYRTSMGYQ
jgi:hypothetical protein